ncbi:MAG: hypothetical protein ABI743_07045 [bacterium]
MDQREPTPRQLFHELGNAVAGVHQVLQVVRLDHPGEADLLRRAEEELTRVITLLGLLKQMVLPELLADTGTQRPEQPLSGEPRS